MSPWGEGWASVLTYLALASWWSLFFFERLFAESMLLVWMFWDMDCCCNFMSRCPGCWNVWNHASGTNDMYASLPKIANSEIRGSFKKLLKRKLDWKLHVRHFHQRNYAFQSFLDLRAYFPLELRRFHALECDKYYQILSFRTMVHYERWTYLDSKKMTPKLPGVRARDELDHRWPSEQCERQGCDMWKKPPTKLVLRPSNDRSNMIKSIQISQVGGQWRLARDRVTGSSCHLLIHSYHVFVPLPGFIKWCTTVQGGSGGLQCSFLPIAIMLIGSWRGTGNRFGRFWQCKWMVERMKLNQSK